MPAPTFIAAYNTLYVNNSTPKTVTVTTQPGDLVVVYAGSENGTTILNTPTGNGVSFTLHQSVHIDSQWTDVAIWSGIDTTGGTNWTLSMSQTGASVWWGFGSLVFRDATGVGASAKVNTTSSGSAPLSISTTQANSAVVVFAADWMTGAGAVRTWKTVNGVTPTNGNGMEATFIPSAQYIIYGAYYNDTGAIGTKTVGYDTNTNQKYSMIALEVLGAPDPGFKLINNAEGGVSGTAVTTGNSGGVSGRAWDTVTADTQTLEYSSVQKMHGNLAYHINVASTGSPYVFWDGDSITVGSKIMYARAYFRFTTDPPTIGRILQFTNSSIALIGGVGITSGNQFAIKNSAGTTVATSTTTLALNSWFRLEFYVFSSATVGQMELKIFTSPDSLIPDEILTTTATMNTRGDDIKAAVFGLPTAIGAVDFYMDDLGIADTAYIGPVTAVVPLNWLTGING